MISYQKKFDTSQRTSISNMRFFWPRWYSSIQSTNIYNTTTSIAVSHINYPFFFSIQVKEIYNKVTGIAVCHINRPLFLYSGDGDSQQSDGYCCLSYQLPFFFLNSGDRDSQQNDGHCCLLYQSPFFFSFQVKEIQNKVTGIAVCHINHPFLSPFR